MARYSDSFYMMGGCDIFAIASHRMLGYPIYAIRGFYIEDDGDEYYDTCHLVVKVADDLYYDIQGFKTEESIVENCYFSHDITRTEFVKLSEEEAMIEIGCESPSEDDIDDATLIVVERFPMEMKKTHPPPSPGRYETSNSC